MIEIPHILGDPTTQSLGHPVEYFMGRDCWVDCRVPGMLTIDPTANIGWCVRFVCQTHDMTPGMFGRTTGRPIVIGAGAFIAAFVTLYNCRIGEGSVVALGSVVRSQDVEPRTMVAGNPARVVKRLDLTGRWCPAS